MYIGILRGQDFQIVIINNVVRQNSSRTISLKTAVVISKPFTDSIVMFFRPTPSSLLSSETESSLDLLSSFDSLASAAAAFGLFHGVSGGCKIEGGLVNLRVGLAAALEVREREDRESQSGMRNPSRLEKEWPQLGETMGKVAGLLRKARHQHKSLQTLSRWCTADSPGPDVSEAVLLELKEVVNELGGTS